MDISVRTQNLFIFISLVKLIHSHRKYSRKNFFRWRFLKCNNFNQQPTHCLCDMTREGKGKGKGENPVPSQAASSSSHPGPSASSPSSATRLNIFCFLLSNDNHSQHIFPVTIHCDRTVGDLRDAIKLKKANDLRDIDANKLTLYKVLIADAVFRHAALSLLLLVA